MLEWLDIEGLEDQDDTGRELKAAVDVTDLKLEDKTTHSSSSLKFEV